MRTEKYWSQHLDLDPGARGALVEQLEMFTAQHLDLDPVLCHGDLWLNNVIIDNNTAHLVDWGSAHGHLGYLFDTATILDNGISENDPRFDAFLDGANISERWPELRGTWTRSVSCAPSTGSAGPGTANPSSSPDAWQTWVPCWGERWRNPLGPRILAFDQTKPLSSYTNAEHR